MLNDYISIFVKHIDHNPTQKSMLGGGLKDIGHFGAKLKYFKGIIFKFYLSGNKTAYVVMQKHLITGVRGRHSHYRLIPSKLLESFIGLNNNR